MKEHKWIIEEVNSGSLGVNSFFKCEDCGASGGPVDSIISDGTTITGTRHRAFYIGGIDLPSDCELSKKIIRVYNLGNERGKQEILHKFHEFGQQIKTTDNLIQLLREGVSFKNEK